MGLKVAQSLMSSNIIDYIELSSEYSIIEVKLPKKFIGRTLKSLNLRAKWGVNVLAIKRGNDVNISPKADEVFYDQDILIVISKEEDAMKIDKL